MIDVAIYMAKCFLFEGQIVMFNLWKIIVEVMETFELQMQITKQIDKQLYFVFGILRQISRPTTMIVYYILSGKSRVYLVLKN